MEKNLMKHIVQIIFTIFILTNTVLISYGQINKAEITGAYIYNFAKLSSTEKQKQLKTYNMVLISDDDELIKEFRKIEKELKVDNKNIKLTIKTNSNLNFDEACLVFVASDKLKHYNTIFEEIRETEVLLVSENYTEKRKILLNLFETEDGKIHFEMNKGNIYERKIQISDEVLLLGGTEIDLVELYRNSQRRLDNTVNKLESSERRLENMESDLEALNKQVDDAEVLVEKHQSEIQEQKSIIALQTSERQKLTIDIDDYKNQLINQQDALSENKGLLESINDSLLASENRMLEFEKEIQENNVILNAQKEQIEEREKVLSEKNIVIERQRLIVIFFIIGITFISLLALLLLKGWRDKKKKNEQLEKQKKEISEQNKKLENNKAVILNINEELNQRNDELTNSLEEIKQIQNQLVQSEKMASLGVLSAGIAHEINNPINFVYAGINSLLRDFEDIEPVINEVSNLDLEKDDLKEKVKVIQKLKEENYFDDAIEAIPEIINDIKLGADRTAEIVKGLRNFSRMDKDLFEGLNVNEGLNTSLLLLKNKYKTHIEIIKDYDSELPKLICYPGKMNQAFLNILSNAVDAISDEGKIWIKTRKAKNEIIISIKDNGSGIPKEMKEKLFDPFFTTKAVGEGTGLGLSITYGIINEHKGKIDVNSELDKGTEFIITLPIE